MSDVTTSLWPVMPSFEAETRAPSPPKDSWPLMGDINAVRAGVPEHLIQWRRAEGVEDPKPQL